MNIDLNEQSPFGKPWGRCNKQELVNMIFKLSGKLQEKSMIIYYRDLLYNPCHESERLNNLDKIKE